jgi:hypothetical protein
MPLVRNEQVCVWNKTLEEWNDTTTVPTVFMLTLKIAIEDV